MFQVGDQVSKVNVNGQIGSAKVYEIATVTPVTELDEYNRNRYAARGVDAVYTVRKVGGKGKGGCWYTAETLVSAN